MCNNYKKCNKTNIKKILIEFLIIVIIENNENNITVDQFSTDLKRVQVISSGLKIHFTAKTNTLCSTVECEYTNQRY